MAENTTLPHPRFLEIIEALNVEEVRYVIIGGVAMRLHGSAHITDDMDFCYDRAAGNLSRLAAVLAPHHPSLRGAPPGLPFVLDARTLKAGLNFTLSIDIGALDLLGEVPGVVSFADLWENSVLMWVHGQSVRVASLNDLVAMKRAAGRDKDRKHLIEIEHMQQDAQGLKQNNNK